MPAMTSDEKLIYNIIGEDRRMSSTEIASEAEMNKSRVLRILESLIDKKIIFRFGRARGTRYGRK